MGKKRSKQYLTQTSGRKLSKNKSMNFLFKTMPEKKRGEAELKPPGKKSERGARKSDRSREMAKPGGEAGRPKHARKRRGGKKKDEVAGMFELQLQKHLRQTDTKEPSKSSYLDFALESRIREAESREEGSGESLRESSMDAGLTTFREIKFNIAKEEKKMRKNIKRTIDKFLKKKHQIIDSLQKGTSPGAKKRAARAAALDASSKTETSGFNSKKSSVARKKKGRGEAPAEKKAKSKAKRRARAGGDRPKKAKAKKRRLNFYESEKQGRGAKDANSTRIKTEEESATQRVSGARPVEDLFAPLDIKRTYIDAGGNTGLLCKRCFESANRSQRENRGVHIPQCDTGNCINSRQATGRAPAPTGGIDERLDQAFAESLLNMESEIIEKGFMESSRESKGDFAFKESSIINEHIANIGSEGMPGGKIESAALESSAKGDRNSFLAGTLESALKLSPTEPKLLGLESGGESKGAEEGFGGDLMSKSGSEAGLKASSGDEFELNKISVKELGDFGMLLSNDNLAEKEGAGGRGAAGEGGSGLSGKQSQETGNSTKRKGKAQSKAPKAVTFEGARKEKREGKKKTLKAKKEIPAPKNPKK